MYFLGKRVNFYSQQPNKLQRSTQTVGAQQETEEKTREEDSQVELNHTLKFVCCFKIHNQQQKKKYGCKDSQKKYGLG